MQVYQNLIPEQVIKYTIVNYSYNTGIRWKRGAHFVGGGVDLELLERKQHHQWRLVCICSARRVRASPVPLCTLHLKLCLALASRVRIGVCGRMCEEIISAGGALRVTGREARRVDVSGARARWPLSRSRRRRRGESGTRRGSGGAETGDLTHDVGLRVRWWRPVEEATAVSLRHPPGDPVICIFRVQKMSEIITIGDTRTNTIVRYSN